MGRKMVQLTMEQESWLNEPISLLMLDSRVINILEKAGINTVHDLLMSCGRETLCDVCVRQKHKTCCATTRLFSLTNLGETYMRMIYMALEIIGFIPYHLEKSHGEEEEEETQADAIEC